MRFPTYERIYIYRDLGMETEKYFIITIDTEGDNLWAKPKEITTKNALYINRFQELCEKYNFKPVYLTDYEMVMDDGYVEFARDILNRNVGEVGIHLHAWNSPPIVPLTNDDYFYMPYLMEYPSKNIFRKLKLLTDKLEDTFNVKMLSHRSGRWSINSDIIKSLVKLGYKTDCSVTPNISWKSTPGDPKCEGGTDYSRFINSAYFVDVDDISKKGNSDFLEVPMTILPQKTQSDFTWLKSIPIMGRLLNHLEFQKYSPPKWLRPNGNNLGQMLEIVKICNNKDMEYIMFMLHSSELMPGGSPTFDNKEKVESLYRDMDILFGEISKQYIGITLKEFYALKLNKA
jgi:hypothetical protein